jgi:hypothetical protein
LVDGEVTSDSTVVFLTKFMNEFRDHIARVPRSRSATTPRFPFVGLSLWYHPAISRRRAASRSVIFPAYHRTASDIVNCS